MGGATGILLGTAGWSIPKPSAACFPAEGTGIERYAQRFGCVEINSTFYRSHRPSTYARWRDSVPAEFRFSVKVPKVISHEMRLSGVKQPFQQFLAETAELGTRRGPLLLQCPPTLVFDAAVVTDLFKLVRAEFDGPLVVEPRHASWFIDPVDGLLRQYRVSRVAADPPHSDRGFEPGGFQGLRYFRLHGAPRVYFSAYDTSWLQRLASQLREARGQCWCIFDNTASGAAAANALELLEILSSA